MLLQPRQLAYISRITTVASNVMSVVVGARNDDIDDDEAWSYHSRHDDYTTEQMRHVTMLITTTLRTLVQPVSVC